MTSHFQFRDFRHKRCYIKTHQHSSHLKSLTASHLHRLPPRTITHNHQFSFCQSMLQDLPPDCLRLVVGQLPTASSIFNLSRTSRHFYSQISTDDYAILRDFVQNSFPSIKACPPWRETAIRLTAKSRAWDRRAFIGRECWNASADWKKLSSASKHGFVPAIDSYETTTTGILGSRKEVLAHSASGRVMIRVNTAKSSKWIELKFDDDEQPGNDILDLRLLRPHQQSSADQETVVFRRATGQVGRVTWNDRQEETIEYATAGADVDCMAVSDEERPLLGLFGSKALHVYTLASDSSEVEPPTALQLQDPSDLQFKRRCAKFLSGELLATGLHYLEGRRSAPIHLYDLNTQQSNAGMTPPLHSFTASSGDSQTRHGVNVLATLEETSGNKSTMFLSGWTDGMARLYDIRTPHTSVVSYHDSVDDGQILSILPIGQERFLAGSHQNACLKTYDLRMGGAKPYSYQSLPQLRRPRFNESKQHQDIQFISPASLMQREINIFLAPLITMRPYVWSPISRPDRRRCERYRGAIYTLSSPSSSSPTIYAGISNHIIQLDFVSMDDMFRGRAVDPLLHIRPDVNPDVIDLSCYERPRSDHPSTDEVVLRNQKSWQSIIQTPRREGAIPCRRLSEPQEGWDERWHLPSYKQRARWVRGQ